MFYLMIGLLFVFELQAAEEWWQLPRTEDDKNFYYVGIAEGKGSSLHLQEEALNKAMGELIREHYGMSIQISESAVEELNSESYQIVTKQSSAPLFIKGASQARTKEVSVDHGTRMYVQIRVDKKSLQESIEHHLKNPGREALTTYGESHENKVDITVKTHPQGATISFTHLDKRYSVQGAGDAIFYLPRGRYQMVVSKPGYTIVTEEMTLQNGGREEIVGLDPIHTKVHLDVFPRDAKIEYQGKYQDDDEFKLEVAKPHRFRFSHPDYLSQEIELYYQYPENVTREVVLEPKTSTLRYEVDPGNATIEINGQEVNVVDGRIHLKPGTKKVRIYRKGYFDWTETVTVNPNRDYPLKVVQLRSDDENTSPSDKKLSFRVDVNPFMYHEDRGHLAFVPVALHVEWYYISIGVGYSWINEKETDEKEKNLAGPNEVLETNWNDAYATVRLISPKFWQMKLYLSQTYGTVSKKEQNYEGKVLTQNRENYQGPGAGLRFYLKPKWSIHGEYNRLTFEHDETKLKHKADRFQVGFSYEF